jgi:cytoskeletal protein RodZ
MKKMNNRIVIIGIIIILMIGLGSVGAFLVLNQKHPIALTTPVNNTTTNNTTNRQSNSNNPTSNNQTNPSNNGVQSTQQINAPSSSSPTTESPDRIAEFDKKFPNGDGPPSSYQPN